MVRDPFDVAGREEKAGHTFLDRLRVSPDVRGHDWKTGSEALDEHVGEALPGGDERRDVAGAQDSRHILALAGEEDLRRDAEAYGLLPQGLEPRPIADEQESGGRKPGEYPGGGGQEDLLRFLRDHAR